MNPKQSIAVTPPETDTPRIRAWFESEARKQGYTALEWKEESDAYGKPMGRLYGTRTPRSQ